MRIYKVSSHTRLTVIFLFLLALSGCSSESGPDTSNDSGAQVLNLGNGAEPQDLDPHIVTGVSEHNVITALLEGLTSVHPVDLTPTPGVAESWEISEDGLIYTFHLNNNAKWSNGDPVTAMDFVYSWKRSLTPELGSQYAYMLYPVVNAEEYNKGQISDFSEVGVHAIDSHTLSVRLKHSTPYFLGLLEHYSTYPVHQATIEKFGEIGTRGSEWTRQGNFVGNGPFVLKRWVQNQVIEVGKNPLYWDAARVKLDGINFYPFDQLATEERMFRTGQLHITYDLLDQKIETYLKENPELIAIHPYLATYYYNFNTTIKPLDDVRVRRALAMSIDRDAITKNITKGGETAAYNLTPPDTLGYTARAKLPYDIEEARRLLAEAGYPNGEGFPTLQLLYNTLETHRMIAVAIQQMWKQALNIDITLYNQEWKVYLDSQRTFNYQISRAGWIGDYVDPNTFLDMFIKDGGNNRTGWSNPEYDRLISKAANTHDQNERYELFQQAEAILVDEVPILPIYTYSKVYLISPNVKGWTPNILDRHPYKYVYLEAESAD
jgi:oligopeptide transport system substrate-binding protein